MESMAAEPVPGEVDQTLWRQVHVVYIKIMRILSAVLPAKCKICYNGLPSTKPPVELVRRM